MITCICPGGATVGAGFTVTVAVVAGPAQPLADGVIVNVTVTGALVVLVSVPVIGVPLPEAGIPVTVAVLFLVHVNVVPLTAPLNTIGVIAVPEQTVCDGGDAVTFGVGFTNTVAVIVEPVHVPVVGVIVNVTVIGAVVVLVSVPDILPVPLAAIPVTVATLSLTHV